MKRSFLVIPDAVFGLIVFLILPLVIFIPLFLYTKGSFEDFLLCLAYTEPFPLLLLPFCFKRIVFSDDAIILKNGFATRKKLYYKDIEYINIFTRDIGQRERVYQVFFSTQKLNAKQVNDLFNKEQLFARKNNIIFCDFTQKGLEETVSALFPTKFDPKSRVVYKN